MPRKITCPDCHGDGIVVFHGAIEPCDLCGGSGKFNDETPEEHRAFVNKVAGVLRDNNFTVEKNENH